MTPTSDLIVSAAIVIALAWFLWSTRPSHRNHHR